MKQATAAVAIVFVGIVWADEASDRTGIEHTIRALNNATTEVEARKLATAEAYSELARLVAFNTTPRSELSRPLFIIQAVRFISPDVALVDAATQYAAWPPVRRIPLLLVMRREGNVWKIAFVRILVADPYRRPVLPVNRPVKRSDGLSPLKKGPVDFLVVDHGEKVPTEN